MCGIAGYIKWDEAAASDRSALERMRDALAHRGPNAAGIYISADRRVGLVHRRLAIIDLSTDADQPMAYDSARYWIVFNGEIYNFLALRQHLEQQGFPFRTRSDTEVLLALYARYGKEMLGRLRGMFAFALWDDLRQELFLARDRLGVKPLYYAKKNGAFVFASEIKAILEWPGMLRRLDEVALSHYLSFLAVPAPRTLFEGIAKLPAGHSLTVDRLGQVCVTSYWDLAEAAAKAHDDNNPEERILSLLEESTKLRMVSDVPVSVLLSGGTDSSALVNLASRNTPQPLQTFCVGVVGSEPSNEFLYAGQVAERNRTKHCELWVDLQDVETILPRLAYCLDDPVADATSLLNFLIFEKIHAAGFKVTLMGEGSDELFAGYPYWMQILKLARFLPLARMLPRSAAAWPERFQGESPRARWELLRRAIAREPLFWTGSDGFSDAQKSFFFSARLKKVLAQNPSGEVVAAFGDRLRRCGFRPDPLQWMTYSEANLRLPEMLLTRMDRTSMAFSVEAREPFLDHELFEFVFALDWRRKVGPGQPKYLYKKAIRGLVPAEILNRPKTGFNEPLLRWLTPERVAHWQAHIRAFASSTDYFDVDRLESALRRLHPIFSWYLLMFVWWHETWLEGKSVVAVDLRKVAVAR